MNPLAPIVLFVYRRPQQTTRTIAALERCAESAKSDLFVYCDGPRDEAQQSAVAATRSIVRAAKGFQSLHIVEREKNFGLSANIRSGVSDVLSRSQSVIVLEDDIEVAPDFLAFMNQAMDHYQGRSEVFSISGYQYPVTLDRDYPSDSFLFSRFSCWGWATWRSQWDRIQWERPDRTEFLASRESFRRFWRVSNDLPEIMLDLIDGKNDSWSILFNRTQIECRGFSVHPVRSLVHNTGFDGSGTHARNGKETGQAEGLGRSSGFRFADAYDDELVEPLRKYFANRTRRKLRNFIHYGRFF